MKSTLFVFPLLFLAACATTPKVVHQETADYSMVVATTEKLKEKCSPQKIVVAFDLDNTLLASDSDLGSEQWFDWQTTLLNTKSPDSVAKSFPDLIAADVLTKPGMTMSPVEDHLEDKINYLSEQSFKTIVLSSRSPEYLSATLRELNRNGFHFERSTLTNVPGEPFLPAVKSPRTVLFKDGVFLTAGQNKGEMFRVILDKSQTKACAVVFVDNKGKYSQQVEDAFKGTDVLVRTFRYTREDATMKAFETKDKTEVSKAWLKLKKANDSQKNKKKK